LRARARTAGDGGRGEAADRARPHGEGGGAVAGRDHHARGHLRRRRVARNRNRRAAVTSPTVPRTEPPAVVELGLTPNASSDGVAGTSGSTRRTAPCSPLLLLPYDAWIMPHRLKYASLVVIVNGALRPPAGTLTNCVPLLLPVTWTDAPPAGAGPVSVTVPVADVPPTTAGDVNVTVERLGAGAAEPAGLIVSRACGA